LRAIATDCAIGLIEPFFLPMRSCIEWATSHLNLAPMQRCHRAHHSTTPPIEVSVEVLEKHLDRLALAIDRAGKRGVMYLPIFERIEAKLEELKGKQARVERVRQRLK
jgi:hypothetical protein